MTAPARACRPGRCRPRRAGSNRSRRRGRGAARRPSRRSTVSSAALCVGVAGGVGEALLCDAIDGEALFGRERGGLGAELVADPKSGALFDAGSERDQRAAQAELLERAGSQATGDLADILDARSHGELDLCEIGIELGRDPTGEAVELEANAGEYLAELVVELARETATLAFLGGERAPTAREPFALETVEHLVEGAGEIATSATGRWIVMRRPGSAGSTRRMRRPGARAARRHAGAAAMLTPVTTTTPTARTASSVSVSVELTVAGERTR